MDGIRWKYELKHIIDIINDEATWTLSVLQELLGNVGLGEKQGYLLNPPDVPSTLPR